MIALYIHHIDPVLANIGELHFWWYGLSYALGFLEIFLFARRHRHQLGMSLSEVYALTLIFAIAVLLGGRAVEVSFDEWGFYREHPSFVPRFWLGGMATHGLLIGAAAGTWLFARLSGKSFLKLADSFSIPRAGSPHLWQQAALATLLIFCLTIPSNWTQDVPAHYGGRHSGLRHSWLYPEIDTSARVRP